ncbi:MAG: SprT family zinc-dependent metalloprotease [Balneolales bacterium]
MSDKYQISLFDNFTIDFKKKSRQKNLRIRVKNNQITVSGPLGCQENTLREYLNQNWLWVETVLHKQHVRNLELEQHRQKYKNHIMYHGKWVPLQIRHGNPLQKQWRFQISNSGIWITPPVGVNGYPDTTMLNQFLKSVAKPQILERFENIAQDLPFTYNKVFIRSQKTKWGTCSVKRNLSFNWLLIKCPFWIWDYLYIHELCHTIHFNHSKAFWELVDEYYPKRKQAEAWIKKHGDVVFNI